jgi:LPS-assembly protein
MMDKNGDVHFAERAELKTKLKDGYIKKLKSILADGSRITASEGQKTGGKTVMKDASYTPCEECKVNPDKPVLWQIVADEVTHDEENHSIEYKNAKFEVYGVPIAYVPYFSHSDGTIKQKSGFLTPKLSLNSQLGFGLESRYYWGISPSEDATIGAKVFSKNIPQLTGEYRKRFDNAKLEFDSSATYSNDNNDTNNDSKPRAHLFGKGLWDINDKWRSGFNLQLSTDDTYLREFDITRDNVLENQIYAERFDDRDYFSARAFAFQDVRVSDRSVDQPNILPEIQASFMGNPNDFFGGRWNADFSSLNLLREGSGQDILRGSTNLQWQRRDSVSLGLINTLTLSMRGDAYQIYDRDLNSNVGGTGGESAFRFYPVLHDVVSYPVAKNIGSAQVIIEPTVSFTMSSKTKNDTKIPNEDSQDAQIDTTNIFEANRFPGLDRVEDKSHITYGTRAGIYADDGSLGEFFLGQSYRFDNDSNPFPVGSGLSEQESDVVGQVTLNYQSLYDLNYRFQLGSDNFQSERHELDASADFGRLSLSTTYLYARKLERTDIQDSRQQIYASSAYEFDENWNLSSYVRYDLSKEEEGLRSTGLGLNYVGQCFNILTSLRRTYADKETGDNATEFSVQLGLKNIGSFGTDQY